MRGLEPGWKASRSSTAGVWALSRSRGHFICSRQKVSRVIVFGWGKQSHRISTGKCAPGAITAGVRNCLLKENVRSSYICNETCPFFCNNKTIKYDGTVLDCLRKRRGEKQAAGQRSLIQYQTDYFTNYSAFGIVPQRRGAGNLNCTAAREPLCRGVSPHQDVGESGAWGR